jgi:uncharacterized protein (TIGR02246 family)
MRIPVLLIALVILAFCASALSQDTAADEEAIQALAQKYMDGWKDGDAKACAEIYVPDADVTQFTGEIDKGREAIETRIATFLETYKGTQIKLERSSIRFVKPDLAVWDGTWEISGLPEATGEQAPTKGLSMVVATKQNGEWLLAAGRSSVPAAPPDTGPE